MLRRPDHDGRGLLACALPGQDPFLGPHERLGPLARFQFDVSGRIEGDHLLRDRRVQSGAQGGADALARRRPDNAAVRLHIGDGRLHRLTASAWLASLPRDPGQLFECLAPSGVALVDLDVVVGDGLQHLREVGDTESVKSRVPDPRFEVDADVALVAADGALSPLLTGQPHVQPLTDGEPADQVQAVAEAAPGRLDVRQRRLLGGHGPQKVRDPGQGLGIVGLHEPQEGPHVVEIGLSLLEGLVAGAAEGAAGVVLTRGKLLGYGVGAVLVGGELGQFLPSGLPVLGSRQ